MTALPDPHRPLYHFTAPRHWINDPNGLIQWEGEYHLFYQHNPNGAFWGDMHWGHAKSADMVRWQHLPIAIAPSRGGPDSYGVFSGCAVVDQGTPTMIYTGVEAQGSDHYQLPCLATSSDGLATWKKDPNNPIIKSAPGGVQPGDFRDHCVWRDPESNQWYQVIGASFEHKTGAALIYRSKDLREWEYLGPLCTADDPIAGGADKIGWMWECPDLIPLTREDGSPAGKHALIFSPIPLRKAVVMLGMLTSAGGGNEPRFEPESVGTLAYGGCFYAPLSFTDAAGRRLQFGWLWEKDVPGDQPNPRGWAGCMSLPRTLALNGRGQLIALPAAETQTLRANHRHLNDLRVRDPQVFPGLKSDCFEIVVEWDPSTATEFGLSVRRSPEGEEETRIVCDAAQQCVYIDRTRSDETSPAENSPACPADIRSGETMVLQIFVDHSVIEVFINGGLGYIADRVYPSRSDSLGIAAFSKGGATIRGLDVWDMRP